MIEFLEIARKLRAGPIVAGVRGKGNPMQNCQLARSLARV